jgi:hypothetical protein
MRKHELHTNIKPINDNKKPISSPNDNVEKQENEI